MGRKNLARILGIAVLAGGIATFCGCSYISGRSEKEECIFPKSDIGKAYVERKAKSKATVVRPPALDLYDNHDLPSSSPTSMPSDPAIKGKKSSITLNFENIEDILHLDIVVLPGGLIFPQVQRIPKSEFYKKFTPPNYNSGNGRVYTLEKSFKKGKDLP